MAKTACILYGIMEGDWHGHAMRRDLLRQDYEIISDPREASLVLTHSGGNLFVPRLSSNQLLVLINPPYWPGRSNSRRFINRLAYDVVHILPSRNGLNWLWNTAHNIFYFFADLKKSLYIIRTSDDQKVVTLCQHRKTIIIRNSTDSWCSPDLSEIHHKNPHAVFHTLPGDHDDCWRHPSPYLDLLPKS